MNGRLIGAVAVAVQILLWAADGRAGSPIGPRVGAASPAGTGTLQGRVIFDGRQPAKQKLMVVKDLAVCGKIDHFDDRLVVGEGGGIGNAVVTLRGVKNGKGLSSMGKDFVLDQKSCAYSPHMLLVPVGATLKIVNDDGVLHNVHTFSSLNHPFNVAQPKTNKKVEKTFSVPERISVRCDVHGWMSSWVVVVGDAYSAVTDANGKFSIDGIPPGKYTAVCWQEELGEQTFEFEVAPGKTAGHDVHYRDTKAQQAAK